MIVSKENTHPNHLPEFDKERSDALFLTQPIVVREQTDAFVAICQRDGGDPDTYHWVLVEKADLKKLVKRLVALL